MNASLPGSVQLLTLIISLVFAAIGVTSPLITLYLAELGASYTRISLILASFAAMSLLSPYIWGRLSDRWGQRKPMIVGGLIGLALAYGWLSRVPAVNWAWAARVLEGVSLAAYTTASLALMGDLLSLEEKRGRRMGAYRGMGSLAFAAGAVIGGRLADYYSLRLAFDLCSGLYLLAALCALALREGTTLAVTGGSYPPNPITTPPDRKGLRRLPLPSANNRPLPLVFLAGVFLWVTALSSTAAMWPNFMARLGYSKTAISSLWGLAALVEAPAMQLLGNFSDVVGRAPLLAGGGVGLAIVMLGYMTLARFLPALIGVQVVRGLAYASYTASAMTFAAEWGEQGQRGSHTGLFNTATGGGQLLGLLLSGVIVQVAGFEFLFGICGLSALLSGICFALLRYRHIPIQSH
jgi:MFS family permease